MKLTAILLVVCVIAAQGAEARSVADLHRSERNLLESAIAAVQNAVKGLVGGALNAGDALRHIAIGIAEGAVDKAIQEAEKKAEQVVNGNAFAVDILKCLADDAKRTVHTAAESAEDMLDNGSSMADVAEELEKEGAAALEHVGGDVTNCVLDSLHGYVKQLDDEAHKFVSNATGKAIDSLELLKQALGENLQKNSTLLEALDRAVEQAEEAVRNLAQKADDAVDEVADKIDDAMDNAANGKTSKRNILDDIKSSLSDWMNDATSAAGQKAEDLLAQAEKAADESFQKAQQAIDDNLTGGSDWEQAAKDLLEKAKNEADQLANNAEGAIASAEKVAQDIADSISSSQVSSDV